MDTKEFDCRKCPLYRPCMEAIFEFYGAAPAGKALGISSYEECDIYQACKDSQNPKLCIEAVLEERWENEDWYEDEEEEEDDEEW